MTVDWDALIEAVAAVCDEKQMRVCFKETLKAGALSGIATTVAGLLLGRVGILVGAAVGGITAYAAAKEEFQPAHVIIINMNETNKQILTEKLLCAFRNFHVTDIITLIALIKSEDAFKELAITVVKNFLTKNMHGTVI